jgi:small-conductance mechanosensitive channel
VDRRAAAGVGAVTGPDPIQATQAAASSAEVVTQHAKSIYDLRLFTLGETPVTVGSLITVTVMLAATWLVAKLVERLFTRVLRARGKAGEGEVRALSRVVRYSAWLVGAAMALSAAGINLAALFAASAILAVALGFAMQNIAENFVSGVLLLLERTIKPGDVLELEGRMVRVDRMGIRTTIARTLDDEDLVVPNSKLVQNSVKNYTLRDPHYRIRARVGVAYSSDMNEVKQALEAAAGSIEWRLPDRDPRALLLEFGSSSVDWEVSVWTDDPWRLRARKSELQLAVWNALADAGVTIAFPQLDVHFDRAALAALADRLRADRDPDDAGR